MQEAECCVADVIGERVRVRLEAFADAIELNKDILAIDGLSIDGAPCKEVTAKSRVKVLNHKLKDAVEVEIDTIITTPLEYLIPVLVTGECITLYGVTRIVGYYSRINNWNKSKIGELNNRHNGNYGVKQ